MTVAHAMFMFMFRHLVFSKKTATRRKDKQKRREKKAYLKAA
jgi:hypothetical protein